MAPSAGELQEGWGSPLGHRASLGREVRRGEEGMGKGAQSPGWGPGRKERETAPHCVSRPKVAVASVNHFEHFGKLSNTIRNPPSRFVHRGFVYELGEVAELERERLEC